MLDAIAALRQAIEVVRAQIPKGELTLASVQRLLETAETVCLGQESARPAPAQPRQPARQSTMRRAPVLVRPILMRPIRTPAQPR